MLKVIIIVIRIIHNLPILYFIMFVGGIALVDLGIMQAVDLFLHHLDDNFYIRAWLPASLTGIGLTIIMIPYGYAQDARRRNDR